MSKKYLDKLPNDNFTIETSRTIQGARFKIREVCIQAQIQSFIKTTLESEVNGIESVEFNDSNHDICLTMIKLPDKEKLDSTIYYIVKRLCDRYDIKGVSISQLYSIVYIGKYIYIYL